MFNTGLLCTLNVKRDPFERRDSLFFGFHFLIPSEVRRLDQAWLRGHRQAVKGFFTRSRRGAVRLWDAAKLAPFTALYPFEASPCSPCSDPNGAALEPAFQVRGCCAAP